MAIKYTLPFIMCIAATNAFCQETTCPYNVNYIGFEKVSSILGIERKYCNTTEARSGYLCRVSIVDRSSVYAYFDNDWILESINISEPLGKEVIGFSSPKIKMLFEQIGLDKTQIYEKMILNSDIQKVDGVPGAYFYMSSDKKCSIAVVETSVKIVRRFAIEKSKSNKL